MTNWQTILSFKYHITCENCRLEKNEMLSLNKKVGNAVFLFLNSCLEHKTKAKKIIKILIEKCIRYSCQDIFMIEILMKIIKKCHQNVGSLNRQTTIVMVTISIFSAWCLPIFRPTALTSRLNLY